MKSSFISDAVQWSTKLWIRCCLSEASPHVPHDQACMYSGQGNERTSGNNKSHVKGVLRITKSYMPGVSPLH